MGIITSLLSPKDPRTPVKGFVPRLKNILLLHHKGIIGMLIPLLALSWQPRKGMNDITVVCMWFFMFWIFLWQPVNVPIVGLVPIFLLPMSGAVSTVDVCACYFSENIALFILSGMVLLLLNMSGIDKRIILWLLCSGDNCQFSGKRIVFKSSIAAFVMSMFSNRLIASSTITQYLTPAYVNLQSNTARYRATEPNYDTMRHIVLNAVQTSSSIGSIAILHSAYTTLAMRAMFDQQEKDKVYPDIYNFMQYSFFAFPTAFLIFILNVCYHMLLINWSIGKAMSANSMTELRNALLKQKSGIPKKVSSHEKLSVLFSILYLLALFFRWSKWRNVSWSKFRTIPNHDDLPMISDATVAAIFVMVIHIVPRTCGWAKILQADKKSECGSLKPDSALMWWRFVDKNTNYGYIILIGSGVALQRAITACDAKMHCFYFYQKFVSVRSDWNNQLLLVTIVVSILPNIMSGVASLISILPLFLQLTPDSTDPIPWEKSRYVAVLGTGVASSFGFMLPFLYTPAYFCHYTGKVPISKMIKYSIGTLIISIIILWIALCFWAPVIWTPDNTGFVGVSVSADAEAAPPAAGGDEAPPPEG